mmetsp:Transcript_129365/g.235081  ORF Transcript_129365/g.235081 Transcript_129365/m.235081 type:complete len:954 (-) Transcript_129365:48-2909(-)
MRPGHQRHFSHERRGPLLGLLALLAALLLSGCTAPASKPAAAPPSTGKAVQGDADSCASANSCSSADDAGAAASTDQAAAVDEEALRIAEALNEPSSDCGPGGACEELQEGTRLRLGEWLTSPNGEYVAILKDSQFQVLASSSAGPAAWEAPEGDGTPLKLTSARVINSALVLESAGRRVWSSPTKPLQLRFTFLQTSGGGTHVQLAEVVFWSQGKALDLAEVEVSSPHVHRGSAQNVVDGNVSTKFSAVAQGGRAELLIVLPRVVDIDQVSFVTASNAPEYDPVRWRLEASDDGERWFPAHEQREEFAMPTKRKTATKQLDLSTHWRKWSAPRSTTNKATKLILSDGGQLLLKLDKKITWTSKKHFEVPTSPFSKTGKQQDEDSLEWKLANGTRACGKALSCHDCTVADDRPRVEKGFCTWCLTARTCSYTLSRDEWVCMMGFPQDHVSHASTIYGAGKCPHQKDVEMQHRQRHERDAAAAEAKAAAAAADAAEAEPRESNTAEQSAPSPPGEYDPKLVKELLHRGNLADEQTGATRPYAVLGIKKTASGSQIRKAYRKKSMLFHPDKWEQAKDEWRTAADKAFKDISLAFETIGSPDKRAEFDRYKGKQREFDKHWKDHSMSHWRGDEDFYYGDELITTLTEDIWEDRLQGASIWLVEFYVAWCGPCRKNRNKWREVAKSIEDLPVEVGAVNCVKQPRICQDYIGVSQYPSVRILNRENGAMAFFEFKHQDMAEQFRKIPFWVESVVNKWQWLFENAQVQWYLSPADFEPGSGDAKVADSNEMWIVSFMDGRECPTCKAASTNLLRLSAALRKEELPIKVGTVDCSVKEHHKFCYKDHGLPTPPHRPMTKAWRTGIKNPEGLMSLGEVLYGPADVEPHVAFPILERTVRLALGGQHDARNERTPAHWIDASPPNGLKQDLDRLALRLTKPDIPEKSKRDNEDDDIRHIIKR